MTVKKFTEQTCHALTVLYPSILIGWEMLASYMIGSADFLDVVLWPCCVLWFFTLIQNLLYLLSVCLHYPSVHIKWTMASGCCRWPKNIKTPISFLIGWDMALSSLSSVSTTLFNFGFYKFSSFNWQSQMFLQGWTSFAAGAAQLASTASTQVNKTSLL
jgi:hypothetical protein